jgi:hypothetical protein
LSPKQVRDIVGAVLAPVYGNANYVSRNTKTAEAEPKGEDGSQEHHVHTAECVAHHCVRRPIEGVYIMMIESNDHGDARMRQIGGGSDDPQDIYAEGWELENARLFVWYDDCGDRSMINQPCMPELLEAASKLKFRPMEALTDTPICLIDAKGKPAHGQDVIGMTGGVAKKGDGPGKKPTKTVVTRRKAAPAAVGMVSRSGAPKITRKNDSITVAHREYLRDIVSDPFNEFAYDVFRINPSDATTFPFLSAIADEYESYRFISLKAHYVPGCGSSQGGHVILGMDYDASDPTDNTTKQQMLAWKSSVSGQMWEPLTLVCDPKDLHKIGPVRYNAAVQSSNTAQVVVQDAANLYVATTQTNGLTLNGTFFNQVELGQLWIEYVVELQTPQLQGATLNSSAYPEKSGPTLPQFLFEIAGGNALTAANATNPLNIIPIASGAGLVPPQNALAPTNLQSFGIELVKCAANQLLTLAGGAVPANEVVLRFAKDFEGYLSLFFNTSAGFLAAPTNFFLEALNPVNNAGATAVNQISTPMMRPDFNQSSAAGLYTVAGTNNFTTLYKVRVAADTFLRMLAGANDFRSNAGTTQTLKLSCAS